MKAIRTILIILASLALAVASVITLAIVRQTKRLEESFHNPIIDNDYAGWHTIDLDQHIEIKIPKTWKMEIDTDQISIMDSTGTQVAVGTRLPCASVEEENAFWDKILEGEQEEYRLLWTSGLIYGNMTSVSAAELKYGGGKSKTYVSVSLPYHSDYRYFICFLSDKNGTLFRNEGEAIAYSMSYEGTYEEELRKMEILSSNQSIMELTTRVYDAEELDGIVKFNGSVAELDAQYPIECFRKVGEIYRAAYLGEDCVAVFVFDRDGRKILSRVYTTDQSKQDFDKIQKGCRLEEVQELDSKGEYLFLETGRNDFPRRSFHCTKDGYFVTIEYDAANIVVAVDRDLI